MRCSRGRNSRYQCKREAAPNRKRCEYHIELGRKNAREYEEKHPGYGKKRSKRWRKRNPDYTKEYSKKWHKEHPDWQKEYDAAHSEDNKLRNYLNRHHKREMSALYYSRNSKHVKAVVRKWQERNPDKVATYQQRARARSTNAGQDAYLQSWLGGKAIVRKLDVSV